MGDCGRETQFFIVYFDRGLMKGSSSISWDSCGCECSKCISYVSYVFRNVSQFISYSFPVKFSKLDKVEFIFYCSAYGKISCSVFFFCWKGFMYLCPFHPPKQFLHSALFQTKFLDFLPILPHEVICAFVLNSLLIVVRWSHTIPKTQSFIKNCFLYPYLLTSLRSIFHC